jgi:hypothetical protein
MVSRGERASMDAIESSVGHQTPSWSPVGHLERAGKSPRAARREVASVSRERLARRCARELELRRIDIFFLFCEKLTK